MTHVKTFTPLTLVKIPMQARIYRARLLRLQNLSEIWLCCRMGGNNELVTLLISLNLTQLR